MIPTLGPEVCKYYLLWALKYVNVTYFGPFGSTGYVGIQSQPCASKSGLGVPGKNLKPPRAAHEAHLFSMSAVGALWKTAHPETTHFKWF